MKKQRICILLCLLAVFSVSAAKMDGDKINRLTKEFVTPHLVWQTQKDELKVLFAISLHEARSVVELAQRMPVTLDAVTLNLRNNAGMFGITSNSDGFYGNLYEGTSETDKQNEFSVKLDSPYECVLIQQVDFKKVSDDLQFKLFSKVKAGMGLVLMGCKNIPAGLLKTSVASNVMTMVGSFRDQSEVYDVQRGRFKQNNTEMPRTFIFGKGRILVYNNTAIVHAPFEYRSPKWWSLYENGQAKLMRSLLWVAGKLPEISAKLEMTNNNVNTSGLSGEMTLRLRDQKNNILKEEKVTSSGLIKFVLPQLPGGEYYLDVLQKNNPGYFTLDIAPAIKAELSAESDSIKGFSPIAAELKLDRPLKNGLLRVSLADSPNLRVWYKSEVKTGDQTNIPVVVKDYYMPNLAAFLNVEVVEDGRTIAQLEKAFYFPTYVTDRMPLYHDSQWEYNPGGIDRLRAMSESEMMGFGSLVNRIDGNRPNVQLYFLQNIRLAAHVFTFPFAKGKDPDSLIFNPTKVWKNQPKPESKAILSEKYATPMETGKLKKMAEAYVDEGFNNKELEKYPLYLYGLGNECNTDITRGFTEKDNAAFREMLKQRYGTIGELNKQWNRNYQSFESVPHMRPNEAVAKKLYPEYLAHINYIDTLNSRFGGYVSNAIAERQANAEVGCDGIWNNNNGFNMEKIFANPHIQSWAPYTRLPQLEQLRSIKPGIKPFCVWGWTMSNEALPEAPWFHLLVSPCFEASWFISGASVGNIKTAADYRVFNERLNNELISLRQGPAQLLNVTPLVSDGIGIWENYEATMASQLSNPLFNQPTDSALPLIDFTYQNALNFEYIFRNSLDKLSKTKVLFLCAASAIGPQEAKAFRDYVKNGGILIADINPGLLNDSYGMGTNTVLNDLFGDCNPRELKAPVTAPLKLNTEFNGQKLILNSEAGQMTGIQPFTVRKIGKGYAILLNFTLANAKINCNDGSYHSFMLNLLTACGIKSSLNVSGLPEESVIRIRQGADFELIGFTNRRLAKSGQDAGEVAVKMPKKGFVYEIEKGFVTNNNEFKFKFAPAFKLFSIFKTEQKAPVMKLSATTAVPGVPVLLDLTPFAAGRVLLLQVRDAQGKLIRFRNEAPTHEVIYIDGKNRTFPVCFAYTDPKGMYEITLTDVATGLKTVKNITLQEKK